LGASFMAQKHNAIVTSIPALQDIASMSMLCSDKTGTLTTAKISIKRNCRGKGKTQTLHVGRAGWKRKLKPKRLNIERRLQT